MERIFPVFVMSRNLDELVPLSMDPTRVFSGLERMEDRTKSSMRTLHSYLSDGDDAILVLFNYWLDFSVCIDFHNLEKCSSSSQGREGRKEGEVRKAKDIRRMIAPGSPSSRVIKVKSKSISTKHRKQKTDKL